jgi:hypothetical protein
VCILWSYKTLTPWDTILLQTLIVACMVRILIAFYRSPIFVTVSKKSRHWTLSWASWIQSLLSHAFHLALSSHHRSDHQQALPSRFSSYSLYKVNTSLSRSAFFAHIFAVIDVTSVEEHKFWKFVWCNSPPPPYAFIFSLRSKFSNNTLPLDRGTNA